MIMSADPENTSFAAGPEKAQFLMASKERAISGDQDTFRFRLRRSVASSCRDTSSSRNLLSK